MLDIFLVKSSEIFSFNKNITIFTKNISQYGCFTP